MVSPLRQQIRAVPSLLWRSVSLWLWRILYRDVVQEKSASSSWMYLDGSGEILKRILHERFWAHQKRAMS
jgi:hypothetical protein